ncbi:MAG: ABC transporter ATP-binding protein [Pseudomonadota bacterium]|jgi:ABC-2 type transport system ATP-binding protein
MRSLAIQAIDVTRTFSLAGGKESLKALESFNLEVEPGSIHGLLGPNGAGKTTLIKILSTALIPTAGTAKIGELDVLKDFRAVRRKIAVVFGGEKGLFENLSARENVLFWAALYDVRGAMAEARCRRLLEELELGSRMNDRVSTFSRGMKQRVHLARGLVSDPAVIFLDEPTIGMDPVGALAFREVLKRVLKEGKTILLTTHDMAEAAAVCKNVTFIKQGRNIATIAPNAIELAMKQVHIELNLTSEEVIRDVRRHSGVISVEHASLDEAKARVELDSMGSVPSFVSHLLALGVNRFTIAEPTLEDLYLKLYRELGTQ